MYKFTNHRLVDLESRDPKDHQDPRNSKHFRDMDMTNV